MDHLPLQIEKVEDKFHRIIIGLPDFLPLSLEDIEILKQLLNFLVYTFVTSPIPITNSIDELTNKLN